MGIQPRVWHVLAAASMLAALPAMAGDRAALVVCDLLDDDGPEVRSFQVGGSDRGRRFVGGSDRRNDDFEGRDCAELLAELARDDFEFETFEPIGRNAEQGIWYFQSDD